MTYMLFRRHIGGRTYFSEGFRTLEEAELVARDYAAQDAAYTGPRPSETVIEQCGAGIGGQLQAAISGPAFNTELTPAGEQMVIPGCERNESPRVKQMSLF